MAKLYAERDIMALDDAGNYYCKHVSAMTGEKLHSKSDIAAELAYRDYEIDKLKAQVEQLRDAGNDVYAELQQWALQSSHKETDAVFKAWRKARESTPAQCLAEIKAQAGRDGFIDAALALYDDNTQVWLHAMFQAGFRAPKNLGVFSQQAKEQHNDY